MDFTQELPTIEWFHGYGGNYLGLKRVIPNLRKIADCERDAFVVSNMVAKMEAGLMEPVPVWTDCKTFPARVFKGKVGLFIASYPCQGVSHAGKRLGKDDPRHLWPDCRRFIQRAEPELVWLENVEGHVTLGLSTVLSDLEEDGYTAAWGIFSASEVYAPHQRKRVFILAYRKESKFAITRGTRTGGQGLTDCGINVAHRRHQGLQGHAGNDIEAGRERQGGPASEGGILADDKSDGRGTRGTESEIWERNSWPSRPGEPQYGWEPPRVVKPMSRIANSNRRYSIEESRLREYMGDVAQRNERGEQGRSMGAGEKTHIKWEANNDFVNGPDSDGHKLEIKPPLGRNPDGPSDGLDLPGYTGLSDSELAEICAWMVKGTNRTDELRMCGNGVVPATAERAFRVLAAELGLAGADDVVLKE